MNRPFPRPKAVLFDLFHTLACVPPPGECGEPPLSEILGVSEEEWRRRFYEEDTFGRAIGRVRDGVEAMTLVTHSIDPSVTQERILAAVESRRRRFEMALLHIEKATLQALDRLKAAGIRTAIVSDAGADDVECWALSPLAKRIDAVVFSYDIGVRKPDARIYEKALKAINAPPHDAIFVGDGGSDEHNGARSVGMTTVLVTRLLASWWPERVEQRRAHADWEFEDVSAFVDALRL
jgi:putative hydrolase of the HAD superfamily